MLRIKTAQNSGYEARALLEQAIENNEVDVQKLYDLIESALSFGEVTSLRTLASGILEKAYEAGATVATLVIIDYATKHADIRGFGTDPAIISQVVLNNAVLHKDVQGLHRAVSNIVRFYGKGGEAFILRYFSGIRGSTYYTDNFLNDIVNIFMSVGLVPSRKNSLDWVVFITNVIHDTDDIKPILRLMDFRESGFRIPDSVYTALFDAIKANKITQEELVKFVINWTLDKSTLRYIAVLAFRRKLFYFSYILYYYAKNNVFPPDADMYTEESLVEIFTRGNDEEIESVLSRYEWVCTEDKRYARASFRSCCLFFIESDNIEGFKNFVNTFGYNDVMRDYKTTIIDRAVQHSSINIIDYLIERDEARKDILLNIIQSCLLAGNTNVFSHVLPVAISEIRGNISYVYQLIEGTSMEKRAGKDLMKFVDILMSYDIKPPEFIDETIFMNIVSKYAESKEDIDRYIEFVGWECFRDPGALCEIIKNRMRLKLSLDDIRGYFQKLCGELNIQGGYLILLESIKTRNPHIIKIAINKLDAENNIDLLANIAIRAVLYNDREEERKGFVILLRQLPERVVVELLKLFVSGTYSHNDKIIEFILDNYELSEEGRSNLYE